MSPRIPASIPELAQQVLSGNRRALARAISVIEDGDAPGRELSALLYPRGGKAHVVGVTGAPGTGKSTLVAALARAYRARGHSVGILAVDPSSPFSGGALLGDRVRMQDLNGDSGVYIRSLATRGATGGLARACSSAVQALDAAGFERVFVETVGAGQDEVQVARLAHTIVVVDAPGLGDDIQAIKAGILEIGHILVVNKADRQDAAQTLAALRLLLETARSGENPATWRPRLLSTVATGGQGVEEVLEAIEAHRTHWLAGPERRQLAEQRAGEELEQALSETIRRLLEPRIAPEMRLDAVRRIANRQADPHSVAEELVARLFGL